MAAAATFTESTAIYGLITHAEAEIRKLKEQRQAAEAEHATQAAAQTDKAWLMANLPLIDRDDRQRANALLRRLGVTVRITGGPTPVYVCEQRGKDFLQLMTKGADVIIVPLSQEQRERFKEQDVDGRDLAKLDDWLEGLGMYLAKPR